MALTNENPKETLETVKFLASLAKGFELFEEYGLDKLIKDAYSLSEREQAKAKEATDNIARYESLIAEQKQRQIKIDTDTSANEEKSKQLSEEWKKLGKEAGELKQWEKDVNSQVDELTKLKASLVEREKSIEVKESKLAEAKVKVDATQKEADKIVSELKARADKMKVITEGL